MNFEYENLETDSESLIMIYDDLINKIKGIIKEKNIDLLDLCDKLYLTDANFIDIIVNKKKNIFIYLDILEKLESY